MFEKFDRYFKPTKSYTLKEIISKCEEMNNKFKEVIDFLTNHVDHIKWLHDEGPSQYLTNEDVTFYLNSLQVKTKGGNYPLNSMHLFMLQNQQIKLRELKLGNIDPDSIDFEFEQDCANFNLWYSSVANLIEESLRK